MVPVGEYALVTENNKPKILRTGFYVIDSGYFSVVSMCNTIFFRQLVLMFFVEFVFVNQEHIQHGVFIN